MARLDLIEIEGYRSIRSVKLELRAVNVLIGANGAGKSNLVGALGLLSDLAAKRLQFHVAKRGGANALLHFGQKKTKQLKIRVQLGASEYAAVLEPAAGDTLVFSTEHARLDEADKGTDFGSGHKEPAIWLDIQSASDPLEPLSGLRVFQFHDTSESAGFKQKQPIDDNRALRPDGSNLAPLLYGLKQRAPKRYSGIVDAIRAIAPFFDDFMLEPDAIAPSAIQLEWRHRTEPSYFNAHALSDGTLRFMCLAALLLQPARPSVIVIDEPELGLHPAAIVQLAELVRAVSEESQVILATQSVTLLDQFAPEDVIVAERSNGESIFRRLAPDQVKGWVEDYSLGDLWLKNVLGGRPT